MHRLESILWQQRRLLKPAYQRMPSAIREPIRKRILHENYPMKLPYQKIVSGLTASFGINNLVDYNRIVREDFEDGFLPDMLATINAGDTFWDVGCAQGLYSIFAAKAGAQVVAFDPDPLSIRSIMNNLKFNADVRPNVSVMNLALGASDGRMELNVDPKGSCAPSGRHTSDGQKNKIIVGQRSAESLVNQGFRSPNVMKIDVEGAEMMVLDGLAQLPTLPRDIFLEIHPTFLPKFGSSAEEVMRKLSQMGYVLPGGLPENPAKQNCHFVLGSWND